MFFRGFVPLIFRVFDVRRAKDFCEITSAFDSGLARGECYASSQENGVATLDSVIGEPPSKSDDRRERLEALIERVRALANLFHFCSYDLL